MVGNPNELPSWSFAAASRVEVASSAALTAGPTHGAVPVPPMKKILLRTFQAIFTVGILVWVFHDPTKRAQMAAAFTKADPIWMLIGLPVAFVGEIANVMRWKIL